MSNILLVIFCLLTVTASLKYHCYTRYYYKSVCYRFDFKGSCQPWALDLCKPVATTRHEHRCPRYFCDVSFYFIASFLVIFSGVSFGFKLYLIFCQLFVWQRCTARSCYQLIFEQVLRFSRLCASECLVSNLCACQQLVLDHDIKFVLALASALALTFMCQRVLHIKFMCLSALGVRHAIKFVRNASY